MQSNKIFQHSRYNELVEETFSKIVELGQLKGGEYAGDYDRLANFRRNSDALGLPMESIWAVYCAKHWDAIMQYIKDQANGCERVRLEPISGRVDDIIVYMLLFKAILEEKNDTEENLTGQGEASDGASDPRMKLSLKDVSLTKSGPASRRASPVRRDQDSE